MTAKRIVTVVTVGLLVAIAILGALNWPPHYSEQFLAAQSNAWLLSNMIGYIAYVTVCLSYDAFLIVGVIYLALGFGSRWLARHVTHKGLEAALVAAARSRARQPAEGKPQAVGRPAARGGSQ